MNVALLWIVLFFFFFQAEDGIRDHCVMEFRRVLFRSDRSRDQMPVYELARHLVARTIAPEREQPDAARPLFLQKGERGIELGARQIGHRLPRSEERRVGKSGDLGGGRIIKKKKKEKVG